VLSIVGRGRDVAEARSQAYSAITAIGFEGMQYRKDIGQKALARLHAHR
jgi:phosphoribosylamine--glycine ligase